MDVSCRSDQPSNLSIYIVPPIEIYFQKSEASRHLRPACRNDFNKREDTTEIAKSRRIGSGTVTYHFLTKSRERTEKQRLN